MRLSAHSVLIAGGAKGIGLAPAKKFHAADDNVTIVGRDQDALDAASTELSGVTTIWTGGDMSAEVTIDMLQAFADAWNRHDPEALMSFMSDDCVFEASAGPEVAGTRTPKQRRCALSCAERHMARRSRMVARLVII